MHPRVVGFGEVGVRVRNRSGPRPTGAHHAQDRRRNRRRASLGLVVGAAGPANAPDKTSLAEVLTSDGDHFDRNWKDYDIVTEAVLAVLAAKPESAVGVLADGNTKLTAFVPNDRAFRILVKDLTGNRYKKEKRVFNKLVQAVGVDTVEQVLLYHVVPGVRINAKTALGADGAKLTTAQGAAFKVNVVNGGIRLQDQDRNARNPRVKVVDINKGNKQIAHGIDRVLRPIDLPPTTH
jgi:uncharacterized surface protein with fasciclin (FAS1) repeats